MSVIDRLWSADAYEPHGIGPAEWDPDNFAVRGDCSRARDDRWKLIRYPQVDRTQLFDLRSDPDEITNLADRPENAERIRAMTATLQQEMQRFGDTAALTVPNPKPAAWSPSSNPPPAKKAKGKAAAKK